MLNVASVLLIPAMCILGRAHGAGTTDELEQPTGFPSWARTASAVAFMLVFALAASTAHWWLTPLGLAALFGLTTGHGRFFAMNGANLADPEPEVIETYFVMWWYPGDIAKPLYSWVCMGIKGFFIGAAAFPFGLLFIILWPTAYWLSFKKLTPPTSAHAEWMTGAIAGAGAAARIIASALGL